MGFFEFGVAVISIVMGGVTAIVWMGVNYSSRKRGLHKGANESELSRLRQEVQAMRRELAELRETQADLTLMLHDAQKRALEKP